MTGEALEKRLAAFGTRVLGDRIEQRAIRRTRDAVVVQLTAKDGRQWFAKCFRRRRAFESEIFAHTRWVSSIQGHAPTLIGTDEHLRAVLLSSVPGRRPRRPSLRLCREAGRLLRAFHAAATPRCHADVAVRMATKVTLQIERARRLGIDLDEAWLIRQVAHARDLGPLPVVSCHGDFVPRNWRVDQGGRLSVLDFENAHLNTAAYDMAGLLFRFGWERPERMTAFLAGYGETLCAKENEFANAQLAVNATGMLIWAHRNHRPAMQTHARSVLDGLRQGFRFRLC